MVNIDLGKIMTIFSLNFSVFPYTYQILFLILVTHMSTPHKNYFEESLAFHKAHHGKLETVSKTPIQTREDLSLAYTPGVAAPCLAIAKNPEDAYLYTLKSNTVAVISDGSAVLGLGNIGALA